MGAGSGEAYLLVFDPQNASSRSAFIMAQSLAGGAHGAWGALSTTEGQNRSSSSTSTSTDSTDRNRSTTGTTTTGTSSSTGTSTTGTGTSVGADRHSQGAGTYASANRVRVTGTLMQRGGIQAIQVADVSKATGSSSTSSSSGL